MFIFSKYPEYQLALEETNNHDNEILASALFCVNNSDEVRVRLDLELNFYLSYYINSSGKGKTVNNKAGVGDNTGDMRSGDSNRMRNYFNSGKHDLKDKMQNDVSIRIPN
jgi:hypothetical protein